MKRLEEWSLFQRVAQGIGFLLTAISVLLIIIRLTGAEAQPQQNDLYADVPPDPALLTLDKQALAEAYEQQVRHLFSIWVKGQARSTTEITNGLRIARQAYGMAAAQIAKREQQQDYQQQNKGTSK
jgi:hypothetical protein